MTQDHDNNLLNPQARSTNSQRLLRIIYNNGLGNGAEAEDEVKDGFWQQFLVAETSDEEHNSWEWATTSELGYNSSEQISSARTSNNEEVLGVDVGVGVDSEDWINDGSVSSSEEPIHNAAKHDNGSSYLIPGTRKRNWAHLVPKYDTKRSKSKKHPN